MSQDTDFDDEPKPAPRISDTAAAISAGEQIGAVIGKTIDLPRHRPIVLIRKGSQYELSDVSGARMANPDALKRTAIFTSVDSFCEYVNDFSLVPADKEADGQTRIYAELPSAGPVPRPGDSVKPISNFTVTSILDDHAFNKPPQWCDHRAMLTLPRSTAWAEWLSIHRKPLNQRELAEFLEDHIAQIVRPDAARMLDIASNINVSKAATFKSAVRVDNGQVQVQYVENVKDEARDDSFKIPTEITISVPVFEFTKPVTLKVRLRYRIESNALSLMLIIDRNPADVEREAFINDVCTRIQSQTELTVLFGGVLPE